MYAQAIYFFSFFSVQALKGLYIFGLHNAAQNIVLVQTFIFYKTFHN